MRIRIADDHLFIISSHSNSTQDPNNVQQVDLADLLYTSLQQRFQTVRESIEDEDNQLNLLEVTEWN